MAGRPIFRSCAVVSLLLLAPFAPAAPTPRFSELVSRYRDPAVGSDSTSVEGLRFSCGHLSLVLTGLAAPVRAGDEIVGFFFRGRGTLDYESADPIEFPVMTYNLKKNSSLSALPKGPALGVSDLMWP